MASFVPIKQFRFSTSAKEHGTDGNGCVEISEALDFNSDLVVSAKIEARSRDKPSVLTLKVWATETRPIPNWIADFMSDYGTGSGVRLAEFSVAFLSKENVPLVNFTFSDPVISSVELEADKTVDDNLMYIVTIKSDWGFEGEMLRQETSESIIEKSLLVKAIKHNIEISGVMKFEIFNIAQRLLDYCRVELTALLESKPSLDLETRPVVEGLVNDYMRWESKDIPFDTAIKTLSNWIADRKQEAKRDPEKPWEPSELDTCYKPRPRQQAAHDSRSKYVLFGGAMGGGKSHWLCAEAINFAMSEPKSRLAIVKKKRANLPKTIMVTFFKICPPNIIEKYNKSSLTVTFVNGSELSFIAADREVDRNLVCFGGLRFGWIGIDEADELDRYTFNTLDNCLLHSKAEDNRSNKRIMSITSHSLNNWLAFIFNKQGDHNEVGLYLPLRHDQLKSDEEHINSMLLAWIKRERK